MTPCFWPKNKGQPTPTSAFPAQKHTFATPPTPVFTPKTHITHKNTPKNPNFQEILKQYKLEFPENSVLEP